MRLRKNLPSNRPHIYPVTTTGLAHSDKTCFVLRKRKESGTYPATKIMYTISIVLDKNAIMPTRAHAYDAGLDLYATEDKIVPAGGSATFDTGVHIQLPFISAQGYTFPTAGFLKSKSGLNVKHNITSDGVIDAGYTGSIVAKLYNHGDVDYEVRRGDKITQLVIVPILTPELAVVDSLEETERNDNGFGSSGR
jgi:deoxyuridine 5'-triphosphate nucleotidohydrolase